MAEDFGAYGGSGSVDRYYTSAGEIQEGRMESTKMMDGQMVTTVRESRIVRTNGTEKLGKEAKEILLHLIAEIRKKLLGVVEATEAVAAVVPKIIRVLRNCSAQRVSDAWPRDFPMPLPSYQSCRILQSSAGLRRSTTARSKRPSVGQTRLLLTSNSAKLTC